MTFVPDVTHALSCIGADASEDGTGRGTPLVANTLGHTAAGDRGEQANLVAGTLGSSHGRNRGLGNENETDNVIGVARMRGFGDYEDDGTASALKERDYKDHTDLIFANPQEEIRCYNVTPEGGQGADLRVTETDTSLALSAINGQAHDRVTLATAPSLTAANDPSRSPQSSEVTQQVGAVQSAGFGVRRLTPTECERLQSLPDGWTTPGPDSRRYAALGDAVTANVAAWIGSRLLAFWRKQRLAPPIEGVIP